MSATKNVYQENLTKFLQAIDVDQTNEKNVYLKSIIDAELEVINKEANENWGQREAAFIARIYDLYMRVKFDDSNLFQTLENNLAGFLNIDTKTLENAQRKTRNTQNKSEDPVTKLFATTLNNNTPAMRDLRSKVNAINQNLKTGLMLESSEFDFKSYQENVKVASSGLLSPQLNAMLNLRNELAVTIQKKLNTGKQDNVLVRYLAQLTTNRIKQYNEAKDKNSKDLVIQQTTLELYFLYKSITKTSIIYKNLEGALKSILAIKLNDDIDKVINERFHEELGWDRKSGMLKDAVSIAAIEDKQTLSSMFDEYSKKIVSILQSPQTIVERSLAFNKQVKCP